MMSPLTETIRNEFENATVDLHHLNTNFSNAKIDAFVDSKSSTINRWDKYRSDPVVTEITLNVIQNMATIIRIVVKFNWSKNQIDSISESTFPTLVRLPQDLQEQINKIHDNLITSLENNDAFH